MILFPHMLVGATIGSRTKNFWVIFVAAILLHFLFDRFPHLEYGGKLNIKNISTRKLSLLFFKALIDLSFGTLIIWIFWKDSPNGSHIFFGAFAAILPDGVVFLHLLMRALFHYESEILKIFYYFHKNMHILDSKNSPVWGLATESLTIVLSIYLIFCGA